MSLERPSRETLVQYINRYCDETITQEELGQLETWLAGDPQCLEQFLLHMEIHSALAWPTRTSNPAEDHPQSSSDVLATEGLLAGLLLPNESACPLSSEPPAAGGLMSGMKMLFRPPLVFFTLLAAAFTGGIVTSQLAPSLPSLPITEKPSPLSPVAYLTSANGCDWGIDSVKPWSIGHSIDSGSEIALHEGIAEFRLANGVSVGVEGPASLLLVSPTRLVLQYGKLTAHVPWEVTDFQVVASTCRLSACDAEFGVDVTKSAVRIHSFVGETLLSCSPFDFSESGVSEQDMGESESIEESEQELPRGAEIYKTRIAQGRALALDISRERIKVARWFAARDSEFVARLPMTQALPVTQDYVDRVLASNPVHYWRFESLRDRSVANEVPGGTALRLQGSLRLSGDQENHYADFGVAGTNSYLFSDEPIDQIAGKDYSMEMWVKSCFSHRGGLLGLVPDPYVRSQAQRGDHGFLMELRRKMEVEKWHSLKPTVSDALRFLHRSPPGSRSPIGTNCWSDESIHPRTWHHVVAVKQGSTMRLYVNGRLSGAKEDATPMSGGLHAVVGQTIAVDSAKQFVGQLDEISIYDRALTEQEIGDHYRSVERAQELRRSQQVKEI